MKPLIIANWKCNPVKAEEAESLFNSVKKGVKDIRGAEVVICPPFIYLSKLEGLALGAQNCFWQDKGAYTGEVSVAMIKNSGCDYIIIGHSERRRHFQETDEMINKKLKAALLSDLSVIFCVGETQEEREGDKTEQILHQEIVSGLNGVPLSKIPNLVIAYEPVWAIGTGNACDVEESQKMALVIRKIISKIYNLNISKKIRILYGGSVNSKNGQAYLNEGGFQGLLIGSASLDSKEFVDLVKKVC
ncbi:MAG: triose-phosphate isomerase [bacterium]|nr:triose-phosphate isomerase [bacterium]